jgi:hypothetical protein
MTTVHLIFDPEYSIWTILIDGQPKWLCEDAEIEPCLSKYLCECNARITGAHRGRITIR